MKIIVTGASGFVGRQLCKDLLEQGYDIIPYKRTVPFSLQVKGDVYAIVHLAAKVHQFEKCNFDEYYNSNVKFTQELIKGAIEFKVEKFIFISTIRVCGSGMSLKEYLNNQSWSGYNEQSAFDTEGDMYAKSKELAEKYLNSVIGDTSLKSKRPSIIILRPPLIYGKDVKANFLSLIKWAKSGYPYLFGGIQNKRSFLYVKNFTNIIGYCLNSNLLKDHTFNIADDTVFSTEKLIVKLASILNTKIIVLKIPPSIFEILSSFVPFIEKRWRRISSSLIVDDHKFRELSGWSPPYSQEDSLAETIKEFRKKSY